MSLNPVNFYIFSSYAICFDLLEYFLCSGLLGVDWNILVWPYRTKFIRLYGFILSLGNQFFLMYEDKFRSLM